MRPPLWIDGAGAREAQARDKKRWATLTEEQQAAECGVTLDAYRRMCQGAYAMGQGLDRGLSDAMERTLNRAAKGKP